VRADVKTKRLAGNCGALSLRVKAWGFAVYPFLDLFARMQPPPLYDLPLFFARNKKKRRPVCEWRGTNRTKAVFITVNCITIQTVKVLVIFECIIILAQKENQTSTRNDHNSNHEHTDEIIIRYSFWNEVPKQLKNRVTSFKDDQNKNRGEYQQQRRKIFKIRPKAPLL
jgi:hypothetical protein